MPPKDIFTRILRFAGVTLLGAFTPLLCVVFLSHKFGDAAFLALGLGQSLGALGAILTGWGWDVNGPQRLGVLTGGERAELLYQSLVSRLWILALVAPLLGGAAWGLAPTHQEWLTVLVSLATITQGLSPNWWCVGVGSAGAVMAYDTLPRALAAAASALLLLMGAQPLTYPALTIGAVAISYTAFYHRRIRRRATPSVRTRVYLPLRQNARAAGISVTAAIYTSGMLPLVQAFASGASVPFAAAIRLQGYWNLATLATTNALMGAVSTSHKAGEAIGRKHAVLLLAAQSVLLALPLLVGGPFIARTLFNVELGHDVTAMLAGSFTLVGVNTAIGKLVLVPRGQEQTVLSATAWASAVGALAIIPLATTFSATGSVFALLLAEFTAFAVMVIRGKLLPLPRPDSRSPDHPRS